MRHSCRDYERATTAMGNVKLIALICALRVYICLPTNLDGITSTPHTRIWDIKEIYELGEQPYVKYETFSDGPPKMLSSYDHVCYQAHLNCTVKWIENSKRNDQTFLSSVCAQHAKYGLVNFRKDCDIHLENCLIDNTKKQTGSKHSKADYYYNGRGKSCDYYSKQTYSIVEAIKLYILHGDRKLETLKKEMEQKKKLNGNKLINIINNEVN